MTIVDETHRDTWSKLQADSASRMPDALKSGGPGGTLPPMDVVDAKISAAEARTDTKFSELLRHMDQYATRQTVWRGVASTIAAVVTGVGVILGVLAFGGDRFDAGVGAGSALAPYAEQQRDRDAKQDARLEQILDRLPAKPAAK